MPTRPNEQLLQDPDTLATVLLLLVRDRLVRPPVTDDEFIHWDPQTIQDEIEAEFADDIHPANYNKLMAAISLVASNAFYKDLDEFIRICNALYSGTFTPATFDPADAAEIAWGITEAVVIYPPDEPEPFTAEIQGYIGAALKNEGIMVPPDVLRLGLVDPVIWQNVQGAWSDDPVMFASIYDAEQQKTEAINTMIKERLAMLMQQLDKVRLEHGAVDGIIENLLRALDQQAVSGG